MTMAAAQGRMIVSADTDFGALLAHHRATGPSVLLVREIVEMPPRELVDVIVRHLDVLEDVRLQDQRRLPGFGNLTTALASEISTAGRSTRVQAQAHLRAANANGARERRSRRAPLGPSSRGTSCGTTFAASRVGTVPRPEPTPPHTGRQTRHWSSGEAAPSRVASSHYPGGSTTHRGALSLGSPVILPAQKAVAFRAAASVRSVSSSR